MYLYGKNQIKERIKANPKSISRIFFRQNSDYSAIKEMAESADIESSLLDEKEFGALAKNFNTQGIIAEIDSFEYTPLEDLLERPDHDKMNFLILSNITDPQNLGAILRTAACFGNLAVIIPRHRSAAVNETVLRVACGAENYVPVVQVTNIIPAMEDAKKNGYWTVGSVVEDGDSVLDFKFPFPLCLVIGAEDKGIRKGVMNNLDFRVSLPMPGKALSLNAAVATAIFCYEITRQSRAGC